MGDEPIRAEGRVASPFQPEAVARRLAAAHPEALLPCPCCAASLKASGLDKHLAKVHAGQRAEGQRWVGSDQAAGLPLALLGAALVGAGLGGVQLWPAWERPILLLLVLSFGLVLGLFLLAALGKLSATVTLDGDRLEARTLFGLSRRSVLLSKASVAVGSLVESRRSALATANHPSPSYDEVKAGSYLSVSDGSAQLTLGSRKGTGLRKHWDPSGWTATPKRRRWQVTLDRDALVAIEYALAERGRLTPRTPH